ncbi:hypothetical protein D3C86_2034320 [compost metagenome]
MTMKIVHIGDQNMKQKIKAATYAVAINNLGYTLYFVQRGLHMIGCAATQPDA